MHKFPYAGRHKRLAFFLARMAQPACAHGGGGVWRFCIAGVGHHFACSVGQGGQQAHPDVCVHAPDVGLAQQAVWSAHAGGRWAAGRPGTQQARHEVAVCAGPAQPPHSPRHGFCKAPDSSDALGTRGAAGCCIQGALPRVVFFKIYVGGADACPAHACNLGCVFQFCLGKESGGAAAPSEGAQAPVRADKVGD